jgi:hypothetical protein
MKKLTTLTVAEVFVVVVAMSIMSSILSIFVANVQNQSALWILLQLAGVVLVFAAIFWVVGKLTGWRSQDMWAIALFTATLVALIQYAGRLGTEGMNPGDLVFWCLYGVVVALFLVVFVGYYSIGLYSDTTRTGWLLVLGGVLAWGIGFLRLSGEISAWFFTFASLGTLAIIVGVWKVLRTRSSKVQGSHSQERI